MGQIMTRGNLPVPLIAGKTLREIELFRHQVGRYALERPVRGLAEARGRISEGTFGYRISMPCHLDKKLLALLLSSRLLRKHKRLPNSVALGCCSGSAMEQ